MGLSPSLSRLWLASTLASGAGPVISQQRKNCAFPPGGSSRPCYVSSTGQHMVGRVRALKQV